MVSAPYQTGPTPSVVGAPSVGAPNIQQQQRAPRPFRQATLERTDLTNIDVQVFTAAVQKIPRILPGTGFVYGMNLQVQAVHPSNNSANVAYNEDAIYNALDRVTFRDVNGFIFDAGGWDAKQISRYGGWERWNLETSADAALYGKTTGTGNSGGDFNYHQWVPIALNRRTLLGLLGNQDRAQNYFLNADLAASATVYSTAPTAAPNVTITRHYYSYQVPNAMDTQGNPQQQVPPFYGVIPYVSESVNPNAPAGGSAVTHYLQRLNTTFRGLLLVFRSNGSRASAESNMPSLIQLRIGNQSIFNENYQARRKMMWDRYGFDAPSGVLMYDMIHDFDGQAHAELGNDWYWTQQLVEVEFIITYPSGFGTTNNSLTVVTSDMTIPEGMQLFAQ